jgi:hypothetical protein
MPRMCGDCAKKSGMSLEERTELALSGVNGEKYSCSVCFKVKEIPKIKGNRISVPKVVVVAKPVITPKMRKEPVESDIEQLSFFSTADHIIFN